MVNSYGQKPMEKPWIITHGDFMEFFCKGRQTHTDFIICPMLYAIAMGQTKVSLMFAQYFDYYAIILRGRFSVDTV